MDPESAFKILSEALEKKDLDLLIITKRENVRYLTGFTGTFGIVIATKDGVIFLTDPRYTQQAHQQCKGWAIEELKGKRLSQWIAERFPSVRRIGVEEWLQVGSLEKMKEHLKSQTFTVVFEAVERARARKRPDEVERIKKALEIAEQSFSEILERIRPGVEEREIALELEFKMRSKGAEGVSFDIIVASGARSSLPHGVASEKKIEKGDIIVLDFGCVFEGYCSDITRVVKVGRVSEFERKIWRVVYDAHMKAIETIAKGERSCKKIHEAAADVINRAGFGENFGHGLGHGVGLEIHEKPSISPLSEDSLEEGAVFTIEPGIYLPERIGIRLENLYWLKNQDPVCLNLLPLEIIEI